MIHLDSSAISYSQCFFVLAEAKKEIPHLRNSPLVSSEPILYDVPSHTSASPYNKINPL